MGDPSLRLWLLGALLLLGFCVSPSLCDARVAASVVAPSPERLHAGEHPAVAFALAPEFMDGTARPPDETAKEQYGDFCHDGPKQTDYWSGPRPGEFVYWTPLTLIGFVATTMVTIPCMSKLMLVDMTDKSEALRARAFQTIIVASAPFVIALCKVIVVAIPSIYAQMAFCISIFESYAFFQFMLLLFGYVGENEESIAKTFTRITPLKVWAVPPLCCCWAPFYACMLRRVPSKSDMKLVRNLMYQFMILCPFLNFLEIVVVMAGDEHKRISRLEVCSLLLAMYGLFALLFWTHDILKPLRTHQKFWALKGVILGNAAVYGIFNELVARDIQLLGSCYPAEMMAAVRAGTVTALLCVPFAIMGARSFTADDLIDGDDCILEHRGGS